MLHLILGPVNINRSAFSGDKKMEKSRLLMMAKDLGKMMPVTLIASVCIAASAPSAADKPYTLGVAHAVMTAGREVGCGRPIAHVFDEAVSNRGKTRLLQDWTRLKKSPGLSKVVHPNSSIAWASSRAVLQLQAADFVAYECAKEFARELGRSPRSQRHSARLLAGRPGGPPTFLLKYDAPALRRVAVSLRRRADQEEPQ